MADDGLIRCSWAGPGSNDAMRDYHDREWGVPLHGDRALFEFLCLEGAQAGLSWRTVLDKRANYRKASHDFDIDYCARLGDRRLESLLADPGLIRNRLKLGSVLGYLAAGCVIGPQALGLVADPHAIMEFAELGVVLMLFVIGLELDPKRLWELRFPTYESYPFLSMINLLLI